MTSTNTKLLLASTALVSAIAVAGSAKAVNTSAAVTTDDGTNLVYVDVDSSTTVNSGDTILTSATTADLTAGTATQITSNVDGVIITVDSSVTTGDGADADTIAITADNTTVTVNSGITVTNSDADNGSVFNVTGEGTTLNINGVLTNASGDGITVTGDVTSTVSVGATGNVGTVTYGTTSAAKTNTLTVASGGQIGAITATAGGALNATINGTGAAITTGGADDTLTVGGTVGAVDLAAGNDTATITGTAGAVDLGAGINSLTITGGTTGAITADGTDSITISGDDVDVGGLIGGASGTSMTVIVTGGVSTASQTELDGITASGADSTFTVNSGYVNSSAAITNVNDININGGTTALTTIAGADNLTVASGATLTAAASAVGTSATIAGTATFSGAVTGGADSNVTGTLNLNAASNVLGDVFVSGDGKVVVAKAGDLQIDSVDNMDKIHLEVDGAGAYATLTSTGAVDFSSTQASIKIDQSVDLSDVDGDVFANIVTGSSAVSPTSGDIVTTNGLLQYTWSANSATEYDLTIALANAGVSTLQGAATGANNKGIATSVNSAALANLYSEVLASDNIDNSLESLTPDVSGGAGAASINTTVASTGTVSNRLALLRGTDNGRSGMVAGEEMMANREMWLQAFGTSVEQDERKGVKGFDATTSGLAIGVDTDELVHGARVGVAFSYAQADVDSDQSNNAQTDIDTYQLTAYGSKDLANDMYVDAMVSYAWNSHEGSRVDFLGDTYTSDYDGNQFSVKGEVGKSYDWANTRVTPNVSLHYINVETDSYREAGAAGNGLSVNTDDQEAFLLSIGSDIEWNITGRDGSEYMPYLRAKYSYDMMGDEVETTSTFLAGGSAFTSEGADIARSSLGLGAGVNVVTTSGFEFTAGYDAEIKEDFLAHTGMLQARWSF